MRSPRKRWLPPSLFVALLLSVLLHQVILIAFSIFFKTPEKEPEKRLKVTVVEVPPPEKPRTAEKEPRVKPPSQPQVATRPPLKPRSSERVASAAETAQQPVLQPEVTEPPAGEPETEPPSPHQTKVDLDWSGFERTFSQQAETEREAFAQESLRRRGTPLGIGKHSATVRNALASSKGWVGAGNQEPLGSRQKIFRTYIEIVHEVIHAYFADSFLASLSVFSPNDPLNDFSLKATAEFEILENGKVNDVRVVESSGNAVFDAAAVDSILRGSPYRRPPRDILSWNERVYIRWGFYRNRRKCGTFNAEPYILTAPGAGKEPIPADRMMIKDG